MRLGMRSSTLVVGSAAMPRVSKHESPEPRPPRTVALPSSRNGRAQLLWSQEVSIFKQPQGVGPHSRRWFRARFGLVVPPSSSRGRRESRVRAAPAVSRARLCKETHTSIQVQRRQSGLPCAMVLRLITRSPR
jgi:hypothetical protein